MPKLADKIANHVHSDTRVSLDKVVAFHRESAETQLLVRSELRRRIADDPTAIQLTIGGLVVGFFGLFVVPAKPVLLGAGPWWSDMVAGIAVGLLAGIVVSPVFIAAARRHERKVRATVWLAAFEDPAIATLIRTKAIPERVPLRRRILALARASSSSG